MEHQWGWKEVTGTLEAEIERLLLNTTNALKREIKKTFAGHLFNNLEQIVSRDPPGQYLKEL